MDAVALCVLGLATFRLAHLFALERGPGRIFERLRERLGATWDVRRGQWVPTGGLAELVSCPLCLSVWLATVLVLAWQAGPRARWIIGALAVSGLSCAVELLIARYTPS